MAVQTFLAEFISSKQRSQFTKKNKKLSNTELE